jgi:hypothetical protein
MDGLSKYFNRHAAWGTAYGVLAAFNLSGGSTLGTVLGVAMGALAVGSANLCKQQATGRPFWTPRTGFGL